jgi:hypothetical protein
MPGGSIVGCPKKRAMEIIDELEATPRGIYTGSIFVCRPDGTLDSSIAIRTMIKNGDQLYLSVGGGIVNDSILKDEYQESIDKALSFINIGTTVSDLSSDILERQFGPTSIDIIYQDNKSRVICTKVIDSGQILELSYVEFIKSGVDKFPDIHREVLSGRSMGKAFKAHDTDFIRSTQSSYRYALPGSFNKHFGGSRPAWVIDVLILVGSNRIPYARILETYRPEVAWTDILDLCETSPHPDKASTRLEAVLSGGSDAIASSTAEKQVIGGDSASGEVGILGELSIGSKPTDEELKRICKLSKFL